MFTSLLLSIYLSVVNYSNWQENLTITTVKVKMTQVAPRQIVLWLP